jgi:hypothetical protein
MEMSFFAEALITDLFLEFAPHLAHSTTPMPEQA